MEFIRHKSAKTGLGIGLAIKFKTVEKASNIPNLLELFTKYGWVINPESFGYEEDSNFNDFCEFKHLWIDAYLAIESGWSSMDQDGYFYMRLYYKGKSLQLEFEDFQNKLLEFNSRQTRKKVFKYASKDNRF